MMKAMMPNIMPAYTEFQVSNAKNVGLLRLVTVERGFMAGVKVIILFITGGTKVP